MQALSASTATTIPLKRPTIILNMLSLLGVERFLQKKVGVRDASLAPNTEPDLQQIAYPEADAVETGVIESNADLDLDGRHRPNSQSGIGPAGWR